MMDMAWNGMGRKARQGKERKEKAFRIIVIEEL